MLRSVTGRAGVGQTAVVAPAPAMGAAVLVMASMVTAAAVEAVLMATAAAVAETTAEVSC